MKQIYFDTRLIPSFEKCMCYYESVNVELENSTSMSAVDKVNYLLAKEPYYVKFYSNLYNDKPYMLEFKSDFDYTEFLLRWS